MVEKEKYVVTHIDADTATDKREPNTALDIVNLEVTNNRGTASLSPIPDKSQFGTNYIGEILGRIEFSNSTGAFIYFIVLNSGGVCYVTKLDIATQSITNVTPAGMSVTYSSGTILDTVIVQETEDIIKLYWCGGGEQLCSINVLEVLPDEIYDPRIVQPIELTVPVITSTLVGGSLKAGTIQYAYSLFQLHGSETLLSDLSLSSSISKDYKGGESGQVMNLSKRVEITLTNYEAYPYIRIYSIHYQELNQLPKVTLIYESKIISNTVSIIDDGNLFISEYSLDEFYMIGGKLIVANTISQKNNRLFIGNFKNTFFDVPFSDAFDWRVYQYSLSSDIAFIEMEDGSDMRRVPSDFVIPETFDCVNSGITTYKYRKNSTQVGATGKNFELAILDDPAGDLEKNKSLKQGEIYRIGIVFFDKYMRKSPAKWMVDIQIPRYTTYPLLGLTIRFAGNLAAWQAAGVTGFQSVIVQRPERDRTVSSQGVLIPGVEWVKYVTGDMAYPYVTPGPLVKRILNSSLSNLGGNIYVNITPDVDYSTRVTVDTKYPRRQDLYEFMFSSDTIFEEEPSAPYSQLYISRRGASTDSPITSQGRTFIKLWKDGAIFSDIEKYGIRYNDLTALISGFPQQLFTEVAPSGAEIQQFEVTHIHKHTVEQINENKVVTLDLPSTFIDRNSSKSYSNFQVATFSDLFELIADGSTNPEPASYSSQFPKCFFFQAPMGWNENITGTPESWGVFAIRSSLVADETKLPIVELVRTVRNQYGGKTHQVKNSNAYLVNGTYTKIDHSGFWPADSYIGDVTIGPLIINLSDGLDTKKDNYWNIYQYITLDRVEHNVDVYSRYDELYSKLTNPSINTLWNAYRLDDNHKLLGAYNQENTLHPVYGSPETFTAVTDYPNSVVASKVKIPNEVVDSWISYLPNENLTLQGSYGTLTKLFNFKNEIYAFQERATSQLLIQPKVQIQASIESGVELGTGQVLYNYQYINTVSGTVAPLSIVTDDNLLFYYDHITNTINAITGEEISKTRFIQGLLNSHIPSSPKKMTAAYSSIRNEFYFYFKDTLIVYNTILQQFQRRETVDDSTYYLSARGLLFSTNSAVSPLYLHYSDTVKKEGEVTYVFAPNPTNEKVFHNIEYRSRGDIRITEVSVKTAGGLTGITSIVGSSTRVKTFEKFRIKRLHLPRIEGSRDRIRDTHILTTLKIQDGIGDTTERSYLDDLVLMYNIKG